MPRIPTYEAKIPPEATGVVPTVSPQTAGIVGESMASAGWDLARTGLALDEARKQVGLQKALNEAQGQLLNFENEALADPDWETADTRTEAKVKEVREKQVSQLKDPRQQEQFGLYFDRAAASMSVRVKRDARGKMIDAGRASAAEALIQTERAYHRSQTDAEREAVLAEGRDLIRRNVALGFLSAQEGVKWSEDFVNQVNETRLKALIDVNPRQALAELQDKTRHDYLSPQDRVALVHTARQAVEAEDKDIKAAAVYQELAKAFPNDPAAAMERVSDPDYQKSKGLTLGQVREVYNFFAVEQAKRREDEDRRRQDGKRREVGAFVQAMMANDRSKAAAVLAGSKFMEPETRLHAWESLKKSAWETDPMVEAQVTLGIIRGQITTEEQLARYIGHGLSPNEFESKRRLLQDEQKSRGRLSQFDLAVKWFEGQYADSDERRQKQPLFVNALNALVEQQGLKSYDPKVFELGKKLVEEQTGGSFLVKNWRWFEKISEAAPWLSGETIDTAPFQSVLNAPGGTPAAARLVVPASDPDLPGATAQEVEAVYQTLQNAGYALTPANKQALLKKIRAKR